MAVRPKADSSLQWAWRPDEATTTALTRGVRKLKKAYFNPGAEKPHEGGNMAKALAVERKLIAKSRPKPKRRKKMKPKKVTLRELVKRSQKKVYVDDGPVMSPEKKAKGKTVALKALCAQLDLDPKATRVKLRRLIATGKIDFHDQSQRWEFTPAQVKVIREHLS